MSVPVKGQADYLNLGDWNAICSVCGRKYKASEMVRQPDGVGTPWGGGTYVCKRDYRPRQPQDFVRGIPDKMAPPWVQPRPSVGSFARLPNYNVDEDTDELIVYINVGSPNAVGVRMVITIAPGVTLSALTLVKTTSTDDDVVNYADSVVINNNGVLGPMIRPEDLPVVIRNFSGGARGIALKFIQQPTDTAVDSTITPAVTVALVNLLDNDAVITDFDGEVELELIGGPGTGILSGTLAVDAAAGVATFSDLSVDVVGTGYSLVATATDPLIDVSRTSNSFEITEGYTLIIAANTTIYNVRNQFIALYGSPPADVVLKITVNSGVEVHGTGPNVLLSGLLFTGSWPGTPVFTLINNGYIIGKGGAGGGAAQYPSAGAGGGLGGTAIHLAGQSVTITNASGHIWGGGGGGGGGGSASIEGGNGNASGAGGGAGAGTATGGTADVSAGVGDWTIAAEATNGGTTSGSLVAQTGGVGGTGAIVNGTGPMFGGQALGGAGGAGGNYGVDGTNGSDGGGTVGPGAPFATSAGGTGNSAGKAINLGSGTATFVSGSGSPNVKGAVS